MWIVAVGFGAALIATGFLGFGLASFDPKALTALIPAAVGVCLVLCGVLARKDAYRKHAMHAAVLIGLLGLLIAAVHLGMKLPGALSEGTFFDNRALQMTSIMAVLCLVFVALCVNSFVQARILRRKAEQPEAPART
jgi:hypothetical protein